MAQPFVHLHCHTDYSLLDGACHIPRLMKVAAEQEWEAIAITDHGNLFGAVNFYSAAKKAGIKPIIGCEIYTVAGDHRQHDASMRYNHLLLLCKNETGYRNLIDLVSTAYTEGFYYKPRISKDLLARYAEGLICLSACLRGDLQEALLQQGYEEGRKLAYEYQDIFGKENFFLEIQDHGLELDKKLIPLQLRLARETGIPLVATNDAHYLTKDDAGAHDALLCVQTGKTLSDKNRMRFQTQEFYLKSREEMAALFDGDQGPLNRTWEIAQMCDLTLQPIADPFPKFDVPAKHTIDTYFEYVARQGFEQRRARLEALQAGGLLRRPLEEYAERLDYEIKVIQQMQYSGYFLIVWDFIRFARQKSIPVGPGRGSAAGSLVAYAMSITDIDPLQYGLLFERFLNIERKSMPDVDIDFCMNRRGEVIQYVTEKYGREQVSQIITFNTMATKAAIKDVGRVMDLSFGQVDRLTKMVPNVLKITLDEAIKQEPKLRSAMAEDERVNKVIQTAKRLEGVARNPSVHAAGVVIAPQPLKSLIPIYKTNKDEIVTQYDMNSLEAMGLLKMDFLGLTTLTIIEDAFDWIEKRTGKRPTQDSIPLDDAETYQLLSDGLTSGVFQFESKGMRDICRRYKPERLEDLCALNALYRPGPIQGGMIPDFIDRKHGRKPVSYLLPEIEPLLKETYGVIVYQEQVMQIANVVAGYSLGEADLLRRAMGKKKAEVMAEHRAKFLSGATEHGFPEAVASKLFDLMEQFAGYGFNKSHSAAYGFLAYITAYLKTHHTVEFMAALLTAELHNADKVRLYLNECRDMGIRILPPDIGASFWDFTPAGDKEIRFGLGAIKNVGKAAVESVIQVRQGRDGGFESLFDFCKAVDWSKINKRMVESAVKAGAMDSLGGHRAQMLAGLDAMIESGQRARRDEELGQGSLFGVATAGDEGKLASLPDVEEWSAPERLACEKEMLGFYVTGHPLDSFEEAVEEVGTHTTTSLDKVDNGRTVSICGMLHSVQRRRNKEGRTWASAVLEDRDGSVELLVFANQFEGVEERLVQDQPVLVTGSVRAEDSSGRRVSVEQVTLLKNARVPQPEHAYVSLRLSSENEVGSVASRLRELVDGHPGQTNLSLRLERPRQYLVVLDVDARVNPNRRFREQVAGLCGQDALEFRG
ncbi:MAG: DNA polymerase III subunit alpha [Bryobacterales bacterium]|nr:DNA polymerase III subunit alpha [Bryobacterales bacterium]MDE0620977.1 DNA polymerase III subunit alpha [Bryobacterales bacterium]